LYNKIKVENIKRYKWGSGWIIMQPFTMGRETYLLSYKKDNGSASIDKLVYAKEPSCKIN
jgi:hypothetical protein